MRFCHPFTSMIFKIYLVTNVVRVFAGLQQVTNRFLRCEQVLRVLLRSFTNTPNSTVPVTSPSTVSPTAYLSMIRSLFFWSGSFSEKDELSFYWICCNNRNAKFLTYKLSKFIKDSVLVSIFYTWVVFSLKLTGRKESVDTLP